jgi:hypothetical protein
MGQFAKYVPYACGSIVAMLQRTAYAAKVVGFTNTSIPIGASLIFSLE